MVSDVRKLITDCMIELVEDELDQKNKMADIVEKYLIDSYELGKKES